MDPPPPQTKVIIVGNRGCHKDAHPFFFYCGIHSLMFCGYPPTAIGYPPTAIGYPPTAIGYTPTAIGYPPTAIGYPPTAIGYPPTTIGYPPTAIGYPPTAIGYPPTAIGYTPTTIGYPPTAIGYPPTAIGYPPTAIGYPPTAIGYPPTAIVGRIGHSELFFFSLRHPWWEKTKFTIQKNLSGHFGYTKILVPDPPSPPFQYFPSERSTEHNLPRRRQVFSGMRTPSGGCVRACAPCVRVCQGAREGGVHRTRGVSQAKQIAKAKLTTSHSLGVMVVGCQIPLNADGSEKIRVGRKVCVAGVWDPAGTGMHWKESSRAPSHCVPDGKCELQWHL